LCIGPFLGTKCPICASASHSICPRVATGSDIINKYPDLNPDFNGYRYLDSDIFRYGYGYRYFFDRYGYGYGMKFGTGYRCGYR
jgi:hypothetical protein